MTAGGANVAPDGAVQEDLAAGRVQASSHARIEPDAAARERRVARDRRAHFQVAARGEEIARDLPGDVQRAAHGEAIRPELALDGARPFLRGLRDGQCRERERDRSEQGPFHGESFQAARALWNCAANSAANPSTARQSVYS